MISKKYKKVAVGGTFDKFHDGHKKLLSTAFEIGDCIEIGVTSDAFGGLKGDIDSCKERMGNLKSFFSDKTNFVVIPLNDPYGTTIYDADFDAIVVSEETEPTAVEINEIRVSKGMKPLDIVVVSFVLAYDGNPISSTRIRRGEINQSGNIIENRKK
ncbi:phosphopantetheine adenylyltransferase [Methanobrevibacter sp.]|uniref:phosphopantetheine adenylyltransferase n=1 Tax=Methanobrevibacter sp. TaxID=66852 RepID=UPI00270AF4BC|nr:phosphopantetheine adenylyltransferase [Methanobrevibacter sp.]